MRDSLEAAAGALIRAARQPGCAATCAPRSLLTWCVLVCLLFTAINRRSNDANKNGASAADAGVIIKHSKPNVYQATLVCSGLLEACHHVETLRSCCRNDVAREGLRNAPGWLVESAAKE